MMTDPIADMLTRIRNAQMAKKDFVLVPYSKIKFEIAQLLSQNNFVGPIKRFRKRVKRLIEIKLLYENSKPKISGIKRISKPGRRVYAKASKLKPILGGLGILIVSTSRGLMIANQAKKQKLGGEVICEVF